MTNFGIGYGDEMPNPEEKQYGLYGRVKDEDDSKSRFDTLILKHETMVSFSSRYLVFIILLISVCFGKPGEISFISVDGNGQLVYGEDAQGNRVPDFSHCGYKGGNEEIPDIPVQVVVEPIQGNNTARIQRAIDYVAGLEQDKNGFRGAVLLRQGTYRVDGGLVIRASGVVLRGEGMDEGGTILLAAGTDRRTLIRITGENDLQFIKNGEYSIVDAYVPVGARVVHVEDASDLKPGENVQIVRPCTQEWVNQLGMDAFGGGLNGYFAWKPGSREIVWDRVIKTMEETAVTLDTPITTAIDAKLGGGILRRYSWKGRLRNIGIENLRCVSEYDTANPKDEAHAWMVVTIENAEDVWVRQTAMQHFAGSAVAVYESCRRVSVEDCLSLEPVSEIGGYRRHTFFTMGQQTLFLRCWSEQGRHDFSTGYCAAGPNAFVQCESGNSLDDSGPIESWGSGVLYDNVRIDGNALRLGNRGSRGEGIGWAAGNSVLWQCQAAVIECDKPAGAWNWAMGCWAEFEGRGHWYESNSYIRPHSLYAAQVQDRLGHERAEHIHLIRIPTSSTSRPTVDFARELTEAAKFPPITLKEGILHTPSRHPIPTETNDAKTIDEIPVIVKPAPEAKKPIKLVDGRLVCDDKLLAGGQTGVMWWRGNARPNETHKYGINVTRFMPGRIGAGFTDDLDVLTDLMASSGTVALDHNYGLWYDRRRDDHQRVRRMNGDVRPPFYEQPFARSGRGTAWDGLSRYDLTKYNSWYWGRLREFVDLCDQKGLVLLHQNYFQHNILEAGAHWADCPWRPANNINDTGFPEPPPYAGDKRIFLDEQFYDVTHPVRQKLHRAYIRQCLDNFANQSNVIQFTSAEFTGPLEFVQFWLDTIAQWKKETGREPLIALSCTKDVQDAILDDPVRRDVVSVIDIRYWWYEGDGSVYAPQGGQHLAPRQHVRLMHPKKSSFDQTVRAIREYRTKYPDKAVIYSADPSFGWAVLMGGGSMPNLPKTTDPDLLRAVVRMEPFDLVNANEGCYGLADPGKSYLIYAANDESVNVDLTDASGTFTLRRVDWGSGRLRGNDTIQGGQVVGIKTETKPCLLWLVQGEK